MNEQWWLVKVYDAESSSTTTLNKFGNLDNIIHDLEEDGLWEFVSARPEPEKN
jgi:hypothetical protein